MKKIAIIGFNKRSYLDKFLATADKLSEKYDVSFEKFLYGSKDFHYYDRLPVLGERGKTDIFDAAVSIGGDGTFLYTARVFAGTDIPIFGVNNGQLGFNTTIEIDEFEHFFADFLDDKAQYEYKETLEIGVNDDKFLVVNDAVISHAGISRIITLDLSIGDECISKIKGDGLIISTPTGSTAYNLSAGGPILHPSVESFVLTPICAHTLAIRPFIVPYKEILSVKIKDSNVQPQLTLDGHKIIFLQKNQTVTVRKSDKSVKIVKGGKNFTQILNKKLGWGI
ncbi:MAG: NAD(+)/NADH kinase [Spirochaetales bacterium]|nr:NAD(+)/NADH kinase [Spirochaetales bacterium]